MDQNIKNLRAEAKRLIAQESENAVNELTDLWVDMFESSNVEEHLDVLPKHIKTFYSDVIEESKTRKALIIEEIEKLQEEAKTMQELLQTSHRITVEKGQPLVLFRKEMNAKMEGMRKELARRQEFMRDFINAYVTICSELEEEYQHIDEELVPTEPQMEELKSRLEEMNALKQKRLLEIDDLQFNIRGYVNRLEVMLTDDQESLMSNVKPGRSTMKQIQQFSENLKRQYDEMAADMDRMMDKIRLLWNFLQVEPSAEIKNILEKSRSYNQTNHCRLLEELQRCEAIKRQNMEKYITKIRHELITTWDICHVSQAERDRFNAFNSDVFTEDLLQLHELELQDMKMYYENNKEIFSMLDEWSLLWSKLKEHDVKSYDPNRFNNRGGQLLREEKERRALNARLPRVESQVLEMCAAYEETHGRPFTIYGQRMKDFMEGEYEKRENEKKTLQESARKGTGNTPGHNNRTRVGLTPQPLSAKNHTTIRNRTLASKPSALKATPAMSGAKRLRASPQRLPNAKRSLMPLMNGTQSNKKVARPIAAINSAIKRRSLKRRSVKRESIKRSKLNGSKKRNLENQAPADTTVETTSYDVFESYMSVRKPDSRSTLTTPTGTLTRPTLTPPSNKRTPRKPFSTKEFSKLF